MTGIINKTARQLDLRGRNAAGIVHVTLNPGFNIVDDETWKILLANKHVAILEAEGAIVVGARKTKADVDAERELADREKVANSLVIPTAAAGVVPTETESKDPNINPETGKAWTKAQLKARDAAGSDLSLDE